MKNIFLKYTSVFLALFVLSSTFSFTVEKHFCGEFLMDVSYLGDAEDCGMQMEKTSLKKKKNCCKDEVCEIEGQDELQQFSQEKFDLEKQQFIAFFVQSYKNQFLRKEASHYFYKDFSPPDIPINYQVSYQTFLI